jgi:phosphopantothenoylcysteine decarboxylase/phosphopantothenate--cysteine ligase
MSLQGKKIILGVCGGIAAYKSAYLTRLLIKEGASVRILMTPDASSFVGTLTFSTLSKNPVGIDFYNPHDGSWVNHVELGLWADLMIVAPATANTIASMAAGISNNLLLTVYLSARCKVMISPAMDLDMWKHPATQKNISILKEFGNIILQPASGELASGLSGEGRMPEPEEILNQIIDFFSDDAKPLKGKKILITAGPTYENIDAVRFIGNRSSGKMGFALADAFAKAGAEVTVIHGKVSATNENILVQKISTESAEQMFQACEKLFPSTDIFIAAAAVSDFTPVNPVGNKIKKNADNENGFTIDLIRTKDILKEMAGKKKENQLVVGFALETDNELENAKRKLQEKHLDLIILNSMNDAGAGFEHDTNKITILDSNNNLTNFELKTKKETAQDIVHYIIQKLHA